MPLFLPSLSHSHSPSLIPFLSSSIYQVVAKTLVLLLVPVPYYVRLFVYFRFEQSEISARRAAISQLGLQESFNVYRSNVIQYFTPIHGMFIATYIFYFFSGLVIGFADRSFR